MSIHLKQARSLQIPTREATLKRDPSVDMFWHQNHKVLERAWHEWEVSEGTQMNFSLNSIIDDSLKVAVENAWKLPDTEESVKQLIKEICPNVYCFQMFNPKKLKQLRDYLKDVQKSNIPLKAPYGIVLNSKGAMLDKRSKGYLAAPSFQALYQDIIDRYMRPISRLLFPETFEFDSQSFAFSIEYQVEKDTSIYTHTDASSVTLNVNLNLENENFTGSQVDFYNINEKKFISTDFQPGLAIIHRGNVPHCAHPIKSGQRSNFVLWLYGEQMQIPTRNNVQDHSKASPQQRWSKTSIPADSFAPF